MLEIVGLMCLGAVILIVAVIIIIGIILIAEGYYIKPFDTLLGILAIMFILYVACALSYNVGEWAWMKIAG